RCVMTQTMSLGRFPVAVALLAAALAAGEARAQRRVMGPRPPGGGGAVGGEMAGGNPLNGRVAGLHPRGAGGVVGARSTPATANGMRVGLASLRLGDAAQVVAATNGVALRLTTVQAQAMRKGADDKQPDDRKGSVKSRKGADDKQPDDRLLHRKGADDKQP